MPYAMMIPVDLAQARTLLTEGAPVYASPAYEPLGKRFRVLGIELNGFVRCQGADEYGNEIEAVVLFKPHRYYQPVRL